MSYFKINSNLILNFNPILSNNEFYGSVTAGAKERLVQITGPSEDNIEKAKQLIESTIKRNASPVPLECPNRTFDDKPNQSSSESLDSKQTVVQKCDETLETRAEPQMAHTFNVLIESEVIQLSTNNYDLGLRAQHLLEQLLLKPNKEKTSSVLNRQSSSDSTSGEDFDKNKANVYKSESKPNLKSDLESASRMAPTDHTVNKIQRSSSQGTVPVGRTSMRFMSCSEDSHKNVRHDSNPTIQYERHFLMECSQLSSSKKMPNIEVMAKIYNKTPEIIRKHNNSGENPNSSAVQKNLEKSQSFTERKSSLVETWE